MTRNRTLAPRLSALEARQEALLRELQCIRAELVRINDRLRPPWRTFAAWASVLLVAVGGIASPYIRDLHQHEEVISTLKERILVLERDK